MTSEQDKNITTGNHGRLENNANLMWIGVGAGAAIGMALGSAQN